MCANCDLLKEALIEARDAIDRALKLPRGSTVKWSSPDGVITVSTGGCVSTAIASKNGWVYSADKKFAVYVPSASIYRIVPGSCDSCVVCNTLMCDTAECPDRCCFALA